MNEKTMTEECLDLAPAITPENRNQAINEMFGDQWLADYLDGKTAFEDLTAKQKPLAKALDGLMVGMLDGNIPDGGRLLQGDRLRQALSNDGWIDRQEWQAMINGAQILDDKGNKIELSRLLADMSPDMKKALIEYTNGIVTGVVDENGNGRRYDVSEVRGLFSPRAVEMMKQVNSQNMAAFLSDDVLSGAIQQMQNICATIETDHDKKLCPSSPTSKKPKPSGPAIS